MKFERNTAEHSGNFKVEPVPRFTMSHLFPETHIHPFGMNADMSRLEKGLDGLRTMGIKREPGISRIS